MSRLTLIVAATTKNGIGQNGTMPWHIPKDLAYFSQVTSNAPAGQMNAVFMGRATWESIPQKFRPLKNRFNAVLSRNKDYELFPRDKTPSATLTHLFSNMGTAVDALASREDVHRLFIIGGSSLYEETLGLGPSSSSLLRVDRILLTRLYTPEFECDVFFPDVLGGAEWQRASHEDHSAWVGSEVPAGIQKENGVGFEFQMWVRSPERSAAASGDT
ncbi:dihydrofolate reductase-like domain-containing protein [Melanogaster broomeanus]|nr:dihydrofolate reductase-like domain-containing protein [Melanogaster broomeanus]